jgi:hypothetical protein
MTAIDLIGPMLTDLLACAQAELSPVVSHAAVWPGQVAWDSCCDGQVWTRLLSLESLTLPKLGAKYTDPCGLSWTATVGVGVLRCAATVTDQGELPPDATLTAEALQVTADEAALCKAIYCCDVLPFDKLKVVRWDALGPEGGCAGGEWMLTMQVNNYGCQEP